MQSIAMCLLLAAIGGFAMAMQPGVNATLSIGVGHPLRASLISFGSGFVALFIIALATKVGLPKTGELPSVPWWGWCGGLLGAFMVTASLVVVQQLGAARFFAVVLTVQLSSALLLDHFGWFGYAQRTATPMRILGVAFLLCGVLLVNYPHRGEVSPHRQPATDAADSPPRLKR